MPSVHGTIDGNGQASMFGAVVIKLSSLMPCCCLLLEILPLLIQVSWSCCQGAALAISQYLFIQAATKRECCLSSSHSDCLGVGATLLPKAFKGENRSVECYSLEESFVKEVLTAGIGL